MLEFVRDLEPVRNDQELGLYKLDGEFLMVSTVNLSTTQMNALDRTLVEVVGAFGGYATQGEETMAFPCDEEGVPDSPMLERAVATGAGSRQRVIDELAGALTTEDKP